MRFERKVSRIVEMHLGVWNVITICTSAGWRKERIVSSPHGEERRVP
jgi:hypothetical protein